MFHGLDNRFLYSAYQLVCTFINGIGGEVTCRGTGFWVQDKNSLLTLVTNRHVVDIAFADSQYAGFTLRQLRVSGKAADPSSGLPDIDQDWVADHSLIKYSNVPENDIVCLQAPAVVNSSSSIRINYAIPLNFLATKEDFESQISICDFVAFPGFPEWHDKMQHRPILQTGAISSDPRYDYSWSSKYEGECVAYEAFSYGGLSGSPVSAV